MVKREKRKTIVPRISQLDAVEFDHSLRDIVSSNLFDLEKYLRPGTLSQYKPEIKLIVDLLIYQNSLLKYSRTYGQQLLNLKYSHVTKQQSIIYVLLIAGVPYLKDRYEESWRGKSENIRRIVDMLCNVARLAQLVNLLLFLYKGKYPTLADQILRLTYIHAKNPNRGVAYDLMLRELLWHSIMELLTFSLPLINVQALQRWFKSFIGRRGRGIQVAAPRLDINTTCAICVFRPNSPCRISLFCEHVACYVCLKANILADEKFCCPRCDEVNTATRELQYLRS